jgi:Na+/proline symporter
VGSAASSGWSYLPIYLGPALLFIFGQPFLRRLADAVRRENLTSIADYISSRFGKIQSLAALVTVLATLAALPYIALQLRSLSMSAGAMLSDNLITPEPLGAVWITLLAVLLALFAILFGARSYEASGRNRGLVAVVAVEGAVKLGVLVLLGGYALALYVMATPAERAAVAAPAPMAISSP